MTEVMDQLTPADEAELAALLTERASGHRPLRIKGGGTRVGTGHIAGEVLNLSAISGVVDYSPGEMTLIARAGTPLPEIEAMLEAEGQSLAFEPSDPRKMMDLDGVPTIGGVVAANASGPRRIMAGACRDHLLGVRFVDGQGRILRNGGRVMKNVTGLDLSRLLCGSYGTLGVLTEVALKTLPRAQARATLGFHGLDEAGALGIFSKALATPYEVTGAAFVDGTAWLRIEGLPPQIDYRRERLLAMFKAHEVQLLEGAATTKLWRDIRDVIHFTGDAPLWRILVKPTDAPDIAVRLRAMGGQVSLDWGGGLIWYSGPGEAITIRELARHATLIRRAGLSGPAFPPEAPAITRLSQDLRHRFDPAAILNPGLMDA